ncbi:MAG: hypothetical protein MI755_02595 [Sphingomonadales bacterium]|nr:hypothetical protein [Sphingomonadales bacterium]
MRILIIHNPTAGRRRRKLLEHVIEGLVLRGAAVEVIPTEGPGHATALARKAAFGSDPADVVVAAGGDGTINEVAAGLVDSQVPLAVIPAGSANVLARDLGLFGMFGPAPDRVISAIVDGQAQPIWLANVETDDTKSKFAVMLGGGYDGAVVARVGANIKRRLGRMAFVWAGLKALVGHPGRPVCLEVGDRDFSAGWVIASNARHYAGPFVLARDVEFDRRGVTIFAMKNRSRLSLIGYMIWLALGRLDKLKTVERIETDRFVLNGPYRSPIQTDGDFLGDRETSVSIDEEPIRVMAFGG